MSRQAKSPQLMRGVRRQFQSDDYANIGGRANSGALRGDLTPTPDYESEGEAEAGYPPYGRASSIVS